MDLIYKRSKALRLQFRHISIIYAAFLKFHKKTQLTHGCALGAICEQNRKGNFTIINS